MYWRATADYDCACIKDAKTLEWKASADCVQGSAAAATNPAPCRIHKHNSPKGPFVMGWAINTQVGTKTETFCFLNTGQFLGPEGNYVGYAAGFDKGLGMQALCKKA